MTTPNKSAGESHAESTTEEQARIAGTANMLSHAAQAVVAAKDDDEKAATSSLASHEPSDLTSASFASSGTGLRPVSNVLSADSYYGFNTGLDERELAREKTSTTQHGGMAADEQAPPPAYGESLGHVGGADAEAGTNASIGDDGRVNIRINQRQAKLSKLLVPALRHQRELIADERPPPPAYVPPTLGGSPGELPPPPMNVVIHVVGSRGDVQPFVALAKVLKETYSHRVRLATHPVFKDFVEENGIEFFNIGGDPSELMAFMVKNPGLLPGLDTLRNGDVGKRRQGIAELIKGCWRSCIETGDGSGIEASDDAIGSWMDNPDTAQLDPTASSAKPFVADAIIANPPSFAHIHCAERLGIPLHMMFTMPWSPTEAFPHPLANIESSNAEQTISNYITYGLVDLLTWQGLGDLINRLRVHTLGLEPINIVWAPNMLSRLKIPYTYCWSPALIPKPADWGNHINISGFYFLNLASNYTPAPDLQAFLDAGPPPVYIGFGSIVVDDPNAMTKMIFEAVKSTGQRALVSKGWGGLGADELGIPDGVFMLGNVPHDWLFQHVSCVVHHGGAGTTAAGIACGKPTVIVPFFGDQPFWGAMVARAGAGPKPVAYKDLNAEILAESITEALKPETKERAEEMANSISKERGSDAGAQSFHQQFDVDQLRCSLLPEQVAVWRIKRTEIRLSALAAYALAEKEVLSFADLKLYRPKEYEVDIGPTDPFSGGAGALVDTMTAVTMGVADFPIAVLKKLAIHPDANKDKKDKKDKDKSKEKEHSKHKGKSSKDEKLSQSGSAMVSSTTVSTIPTSNTADTSSSVMSPRESTPPTSPGSSLYHERERETSVDSSMVTSPTRMSRESTIEGVSTPLESGALSPHASRGSAMAEALRNLPESTRPRSRSGSRTRSGSRHRKDSDSKQSSKASSKHHAEQTVDTHLLDTAYGTGKGVSKIVGAGVKSPMDFLLGLSRGFHNVPKLYGEEVRQTGRVTGLRSGLQTAGKEFGYGMWDGITGLVTQPLEGAKKEGGAGFMKGVGRGIAGLVVKPGAGIYGLPAYAMKGVYKEVQKHFGQSVDNYLIAARTAQGWDAWLQCSREEQTEIVHRYLQLMETVKKKKTMGEDSITAVSEFLEGRKQKRREQFAQIASRTDGAKGPFAAQLGRWHDNLTSGHCSCSGPCTNLLHKRSESKTASLGTSDYGGLEHRDSMSTAAHRPASLRPGSTGDLRTMPTGENDLPHYSATDAGDSTHDEELEQAITASVRETSRGDAEEDRLINEAIRASVKSLRASGRPSTSTEDEEMKRAIAESLKHTSKDTSAAGTTAQETDILHANNGQSARAPEPIQSRPEKKGQSALSATISGMKLSEPGGSTLPEDVHTAADVDHDEEAQFKKALEESQRLGEDEARAAHEEQIVLEYVKRQSLLEEQHRQRIQQGRDTVGGSSK